MRLEIWSAEALLFCINVSKAILPLNRFAVDVV